MNESVYFAYDRPYTYSQNLKQFMESIRDEKKYNNYLRAATLCRSMGGNECKLLTITENVEFSLSYFEQLRMQ